MRSAPVAVGVRSCERKKGALQPNEKMDLAAGIPPATRRSKRRMMVISPREELVPQPGIAPGTRPSQRRVMALSPLEENKSGPAAGFAPAWSDLQNRRVAIYAWRAENRIETEGLAPS
jgi:hypothetical protein